MSRMILNNDMFDLLATAAQRIRNGKMPDGFFSFDTIAIDAVAADLFELNYAAVDEYYQEETERPEYTFRPVEEILAGPLKPRHLVQIYQTANCYMYQTGEDHSGWAYSLPWATVKAVRFWAEKNLHELNWPIVKHGTLNVVDWGGAEAVAWEWTREHGFPALKLDAPPLDDDELRETLKGFERYADDALRTVTATRLSLLARLTVAGNPDASYLVLVPEGGRLIRATAHRDDGGVVEEIPAEGPESGEGATAEAPALLRAIDPDRISGTTPFPAQDVPDSLAGMLTVDLKAAARWSPVKRHPRPSD
ncbi:hypothetical protein [Sinomonas albida]|uniref:hypothetical protein n=1 Tax=Sinomonas albida TaxID=369942 RepID=UPI00301AFB81